MSVDEQYATCGICRHVYRPASQDSIEGHLRATGHAPTPGGVPAPSPAAQLLLQAAERLEHLAELEAVIDGLYRLIEAWERLGPPKDPAAVLRGYLARPPIHAQDDEEAADGR